MRASFVNLMMVYKVTMRVSFVNLRMVYKATMHVSFVNLIMVYKFIEQSFMVLNSMSDRITGS
jgi:hypothetical protein